MPSVAHIIRRRRNRKQRRRVSQDRSRHWTLFVGGSLALALIVPLVVSLGLAGMLYSRAVSAMPSPAETIYLDPIIGPTNIYDRSGETLLYAVSDPLGNDREWIALDTLPEYVVMATLQMEDPDYYVTAGFDGTQLVMRLWRYIMGVGNTRDNSIAGKLARNALVTPAQEMSGMDRDVLSIALAAEVQRGRSAGEVLEWHLNTNYYGNDAYGIEAAAQVYFGKSATELSLDETAMLAAIPPAPEFNPFDNPQAAQGRQLDLLRALLSSEVITPEQFEAASNKVTPLRDDMAQAPRIAPTFALVAREQAETILDGLGMDGGVLVSRGGLTITTTLDLDLYYQSDCTLQAHLARLNGQAAVTTARDGQPCVGADYLADVINPDYSTPPQRGSAVILDVSTGEIRSMVGDAASAAYQPSVTLQPFVYFSGLRSGYTPASMLLDIPTPFPGSAEGLIYTPINPDGNYRGPLNLRDAMAAYLRTPAAAVADVQGLSNVLSDAHRIGINSLQEIGRYDLSLLERGGAVSLLDVAYAYSVFSGMGTQRGVSVEPIARNYRDRDPVTILRIADSTGNVLWEYDTARRDQNQTSIMDAELAYLINDMLADEQTRSDVLGSDPRTLTINRPAALVNGLTQSRDENWTVGYTPQLVTGVHLHRADGESLSLDAQGLQGAAPVWQALSRYAHDRYDYQPAQWNRPDGVTNYIVCERSGLIPPADDACPTRSEVFLTQVYPAQEDTYWRKVEVNDRTNTLATTYTPPERVVEQTFFVPPAPAMDWWQSNNLPLPPTDYDLSVPDELSALQILAPQNFARVRGVVDVRGTIDTENMQFYQLAYGQNLNPTQWFEIASPQPSFDDGATLGAWDTDGLDGIYTLELAVTYADNTQDRDYVIVTVDNIAPTIDLQTGANEDGSDQTLFRFPVEDTIALSADVDDNLGIARVEFFQNGTLIGSDDSWPYGIEYRIQGTGVEVFSATVTDQVGNATSDEIQVNIIRN